MSAPFFPKDSQLDCTKKWEMADVFLLYGEAYRQKHALPLSHLKVMHCIEQCRTAALGGHWEECDRCGHQRPAYNSCRNRHCPKCQSLARRSQPKQNGWRIERQNCCR